MPGDAWAGIKAFAFVALRCAALRGSEGPKISEVNYDTD